MKIEQLKTKTTKIITHIVNHPLGSVDLKWAILSYSLLLVLVLMFALFITCPSSAQLTVLRASLAISITGLFASILGKWEERNASLKLGLLFILFIIVYVFSPASIRSELVCEKQLIKGQLKVGNKPLKKALVTVPDFDYQTISNHLGEFTLILDQENQKQDSFLIKIQSKSIDTSFFFRASISNLQLDFKDTLAPLTKSKLYQLIDARIAEQEGVLIGKTNEWMLEEESSFKELWQNFRPFDQQSTNYRNEFFYEGLNHKLQYRVNLLEAGIIEAKEQKPYRKHLIDSSKVYIIEQQNFPNYQLEYVLLNQQEVTYKLISNRQLNSAHYEVKVQFDENIRCVKVDLECSSSTDNYKIRKMNFYGFLPVEEYDLFYRDGKWVIQSENHKV